MDSSLHGASSSQPVETALPLDETGGGKQTRPGSWQYIALGLSMGGLFAVYGAALQVLLPEQVSAIAGNANKVAALGLVTGISALVAVIAQPIAGVLSDRTRSRLGRRNIWVLGGSLASALVLLLIAHVATIPLLIVLWCCMQATGNAIQTALTAVIPERFPVSRRGTISSISGMGTVVGIFVGVAIGGLGGSIAVGYLAVAVLVLVFGLLYALTARESASVAQAIAQQAAAKAKARAEGRARKLELPRSADYWWAFAGRFAIFLGYQGVQGYLLYILTDYIHLGQTNPGLLVGTAIVILSGISTAAMFLSMALSGWISDKLGRLKPFVFCASLGFAIPIVLLLIAPSWQTMLVAQLINGLSFGLYMAVDQALMTRVLPNIENAARDLGILNIANAGPQVLAPFVASIVISALGGYRTLFIAALVIVVIGALCVRPIRSVR